VASVLGAGLLTYALLARAVSVGRRRSNEEEAPVEPERLLHSTTREGTT